MVADIVIVVVAAAVWTFVLRGVIRMNRRRRLRALMPPPIDVNDHRLQQLRSLAAADYAKFTGHHKGHGGDR